MSKTIGVTGGSGFVGRWVQQRLGEAGCAVRTLPREAWDDAAALRAFAASCDVIVHLAGVNRGAEEEVERVNPDLALRLTDACRAAGSTPHIIYSSTTKRDDDSPYGRGKRTAERVLADWAQEVGGAATSLVVPNVYGAGCRPFYNSVVATFCYQLTHGETPSVTGDPRLELIWVGDLASRIAEIAVGPALRGSVVQPLQGGGQMRVTELLATLQEFRDGYFERNVLPDITAPLRSTLYATFLSYLDLDAHVHRPPLHADARGELCEVVKTDAGGQVFFSTTRPGVTRGNHYHTRKIEWFCVVRGEATIRLRHVHGDEVREFRVRGDRPEFLSIPVLHTHSIENTGDDDLLTLFWTNELFDADDADTHYLDVLPPASRQAA